MSRLNHQAQRFGALCVHKHFAFDHSAFWSSLFFLVLVAISILRSRTLAEFALAWLSRRLELGCKFTTCHYLSLKCNFLIFDCNHLRNLCACKHMHGSDQYARWHNILLSRLLLAENTNCETVKKKSYQGKL